MIIHGKDGWPVETIEGRWFTNLLRLLIHSNIRMTWRRRKETYHPDDFRVSHNAQEERKS